MSLPRKLNLDTVRLSHSTHRKFKSEYFIFLTSFSILIILLFSFIYTYSFRMIFWDQWSIVEPVANQTISFNLWQYQHNEHRIGSGLIIIKFLAQLTGWSNLAETFFQGFMLLIVSIIIINVLLRHFNDGLRIIDISVPLIIFNLNQWSNLTWGFQITFVLPILLIIINLFLFEVRKNSYYDFIILFISVIASRSSFHGVFVSLISSLMYVFISLKEGRINRHYLFWSFLNLVVFISYFIGLKTNSSVKVVDYIDLIKYAISLVNNYTGYHHLSWLSLIAPILIIFILGKYFYENRLSSSIFVTGLTLFSFLFIIFTSIGRYSMGVEQAFSSRYNTAVFPLFIAVYLVLRSSKRKLFSVVFLFFVVLIYLRGWSLANYELYIYSFKNGTDAWKSCYLQNFNAYYCQKATGFQIYPDFEEGRIVEKIQILQESKLNFMKVL